MPRPGSLTKRRLFASIFCVLAASVLLLAWWLPRTGTPTDRKVVEILDQVRLEERRHSPLYSKLESLSDWPGPFPKIVEWILGSTDHSVDPEAELDALGLAAVPRLKRALRSDSSPKVRALAAQVLGALDPAGARTELSSALLKDRSKEVRSESAGALAKMGLVALAPLLTALGHDAEPAVRSESARALAEMGPLALAPLLKALQHDAESAVRSETAKAIGSWDDPVVDAPLLAAFRREPDDSVRAEIIDGLSGTKSPEVSLLLRNSVTNDPGWRVRVAAARSLGAHHDPESLAALIQSLGTDSNEGVRAEAATAVGQFDDPRAFTALTNALVQQVILRIGVASRPTAGGDYASVPALRLPGAIAGALARLGREDIAPLILVALGRETDAGIKADLLGALGHAGGPLTIEVFSQWFAASARNRDLEATIIALRRSAPPELAPLWIKMLDPGRANPGVRRVAADALGKLAPPIATLPLLQSLAQDPDREVRRAAATALGHMPADDVLAGLTNALADREYDVATAATKALGRLRDTRAVPALLSELQRFGAGSGVGEALGFIGDRQVVPALLEALPTERDEDRRSALLRALGRLGDPAAGPVLLNALRSSTPPVDAAVEALGDFGGSEAAAEILSALPRLVGRESRTKAVIAVGCAGDIAAADGLAQVLANDPDHEVRAAAAKALRALVAPSSRLALERALTDHSEDVRAAAVWALGTLGDPESGPALTAGLSNRADDVQFAAAFALVQVGHQTAASVIESALSSRRRRVQFGAACALTMLGRTNGLESMRLALSSSDRWQRFAAMVALARAGSSSAVDLIHRHATDSDPALRELGQGLGHGADGPALAALLRREGTEQWAAEALIFFDDPRTLGALREAFREPSDEVRIPARAAVRRIERRTSEANR